MKVCTKCGRRLSLDQFAIAKADGKKYRRGQCKECLNQYYRTHQKKYVPVPKEWQFRNTPRLDLEKIDAMLARIDARIQERRKV